MSEKKSSRQLISRDVWLEAAYDAFVSEGVDGVRILKLANRLGVTRGSFYWRFGNQKELLGELVELWKCHNTQPLVDAANERPRDLAEWYVGLMKVWLDVASFDPRLDIAMRNWSRRDGAILELVEKEDRARIQGLKQAFVDLGSENERMAFTRARVLYYKQMGYFLIGAQETLDERLGYVAEYCEIVTGSPIDASRLQEVTKDLEPHISPTGVTKG